MKGDVERGSVRFVVDVEQFFGECSHGASIKITSGLVGGEKNDKRRERERERE